MEGSERASGEDIFDIIGVMEIQHLNIGDAELIVEAAAPFDREPRSYVSSGGGRRIGFGGDDVVGLCRGSPHAVTRHV
jgi:hypothetical protein